jgi:O-methyltransferase
MDYNELKLSFLKRILTDSFDDKKVKDSFFENASYPSEEIMRTIVSHPISNDRLYGKDWPISAHTMIGMKRLDNLHESLDYVRLNDIEGDFIETGVWRGGASIFVKKYFDFYGINKKVFVADSFKGLPAPQVKEDAGDRHYTIDYLRVSLKDVTNNFKIYGALDENVVFLEGWFEDTLPNNSQIDKLCILRMDGDMFKSTMDVFDSCYHKVSKGGRIIIDDFCIPNCKNAVNQFRTQNSIQEPITVIDHCGIFWTKG